MLTSGYFLPQIYPSSRPDDYGLSSKDLILNAIRNMLNLKISEELVNSFSKLGMKTYGNCLKLTDKASAIIKAGQT